jgi:acetyl-CoA carboxylase biotin carboxyl carrier protein
MLQAPPGFPKTPAPVTLTEWCNQQSQIKNGGLVVAEGESGITNPFDLRTVKYLVSLMSRYDLTEINLRHGDFRIELRRGPRQVAVPPVAAPLAPVSVSSMPPPTTNATPAAPAEPAKNLIEIKSPTPGTFYAGPKPDAEPFVKVGSKVQPDTTVCIIEAMKVFNDIKAECGGTVVAILVENQQPVEYGQVLFKVDPAS